MKTMEKLTDVKFGCKLISFLIALTLISGWHSVYVGFDMVLKGTSSLNLNLIVLLISFLFLIFNLLAAFGLYRSRQWGFIFAYIAIPFTTFLFGLSYIPYVPRLLPTEFWGWGTVLINLSLLLYTIYLNVKWRRSDKFGTHEAKTPN